MNDNLFPGYSFEAALATRTYEDDAPNFTPRISGVVDMRRGGVQAVHRQELRRQRRQRAASDLRLSPTGGRGGAFHQHLREERRAHPQLCRGADAHRHRRERRQSLCEKLWASLNENNKVSLFVRTITLETGNYEDTIVNKYNAVEG